MSGRAAVLLLPGAAAAVAVAVKADDFFPDSSVESHDSEPFILARRRASLCRLRQPHRGEERFFIERRFTRIPFSARPLAGRFPISSMGRTPTTPPVLLYKERGRREQNAAGNAWPDGPPKVAVG